MAEKPDEASGTQVSFDRHVFNRRYRELLTEETSACKPGPITSTLHGFTFRNLPEDLVFGMGYSDAPLEWWKTFVGAMPPRTAKLAIVRADGSAHVAPVWVDLDGDDIVFMTAADTIKGKAILRDNRVCLCWDDEAPPFSFVTIAGTATTSTDPAELLAWGTRIGGRYMGEDQAEAYGRRNAVEPEMVVRVTPTKITAKEAIAS